MRLLALILLFALASCSTTVPVVQKFPDAPEELFEKCPDLLKAEPTTTSISELLKTVVKNYQLYYQCSIKQEGWMDWHKSQKTIFDEVSK